MKGKRLSILVAIWMALLPVSHAWATNPYKDIDFRHWAAQPAYVLHELEIMPGVAEGQFAGDLPLTRFQFADIVNRLIGKREVTNSMVVIFSDIQPGHPYFNAVSRVTRAGIIEVDGGDFKGFQPLTRYEFAVSMDRLLNFLLVQAPFPRSKKIEFHDLDESHQEAVHKIANIWQLTEGYGNGTYKGEQELTRYEALAMVARAASLTNEAVKEAMAKPMPQPSIEELLASSPDPIPTPIQNTPAPESSTLSELEKTLSNLSESPKPTVQPSIKPIESPIPTPEPTAKPSPTDTPTPKPSPTDTPTPKPSPSNITLEELENTLENISGTATPQPSPKPTPTPQPSPKPTPTVSPTPHTEQPSTHPPKNPDNMSLAEMEKALQNVSSSPEATPTPKPQNSPTPTVTIEALENSLENITSNPETTPTPKPQNSPTPTVTIEALENSLENITSNPETTPTPKLPNSQTPQLPNSQTPQLPNSQTPKLPNSQPPKPQNSPNLDNMSLAEMEKALMSTTTPDSPSPTPIKVAQLPSSEATEKIQLALMPDPPESLLSVAIPGVDVTSAPAIPQIETPPPSQSPSHSSPLNNHTILWFNYTPIYQERIPTALETSLSSNDKSISGDAGMSLSLDSMFWFNGILPDPWDRLGITLSFATMGGYSYSDNQTQEAGQMTDLVNTNLGIMYKIIRTDNLELALGLDNYFRYTGSNNDPRNLYFLAAKSYMGFGGKTLFAWRIFDPLTLELGLASHFVMQDLLNVQLSELPLNRADLLFNLGIGFDIAHFGAHKLSLNTGYQMLMLLDLGSDASQIHHAVNLGVGYHY